MIVVLGSCRPCAAKSPKRLTETELSSGSFETSIADTLAEDQRDFGLCLRDVFRKFEVVYQGWPTDSFKSSQIARKSEERDRILDICIAPSKRFGNLKSPVSVHMEMFEIPDDHL